MTHEVTKVDLPARPTAVLAATTTWAEFPQVWGRLLGQVHANVTWSMSTGHKGRNVMLYLDGTPRVEVGVELDQAAEVGDGLLRSQLPAGPAATTVHRGSYDGLGEAHAAVKAWCDEQGLERTGVRWEVYGHWYDEPAKVETEIFYQLTNRP